MFGEDLVEQGLVADVAFIEGQVADELSEVSD